MSTATLNQEIRNTSEQVRNLSFNLKKQFASDQDVIDSFLDAIPKFKSMLNGKAKTIEDIVSRLDQLTWYGEPSENALIKINDLISILKDWHSILIREYVRYNNIKKKGIAKDELNNFKVAIDDLKEGYEDLESIFFFLPSMPDVKETTKVLSLL